MRAARSRFKMSFANFAHDRRYRRAQSAYLLLLLLLLLALWPSASSVGEASPFELTLFLTQWLLPLAFPIMQFRLGFGLVDELRSEPRDRLPLPASYPQTAAILAAELLHCIALWALQSPLVIAAVSAAGFTAAEGVAYLLRLLMLGLAARLGGVIARVATKSRRGASQPPGGAAG
ncbi:MAG: hypothetical protein ACLFPO_03035 [Spirochaetaceae bacterium]